MLKILKHVNSSLLKLRFTLNCNRQSCSSYSKMENDVSFSKYQESIEKLNDLQTNQPSHDKDFEALINLRLNSTKYMCKKLDLSNDDLNSLNVIHITGTKGKGSTSAFSESILRNQGYKTGLFTSPHLIEVKERIKINGRSISYLKFHEYFSHCYDVLIEKWSKEDLFDKPTYFQFLTIMSFYVFLKEKVDVAVVEVGIGGQFDYTNIIEKPVACAISSLGLDHCSMLGNTLEQIAWQKSGILKPSCVGFVSQQDSKEALRVIKERSKELNAPICIVHNVDKYNDFDSNEVNLGINGKVQYLNSQLALQVTKYWLDSRTQENFDKLKWINENTETISNEGIVVLKPITILNESLKGGINRCSWPGRNQIIESENKKIKYYLDGAHTVESIEQFLNWFMDIKKNDVNFKNEKNVLLFNYTGERDPSKFLELLTTLKFDAVAFSKLKAYPDHINKDKDTFRKMPSAILDNDEKYEKLINLYNQISVKKYTNKDLNNNCKPMSLDDAKIFDNILEGLNWLTNANDNMLRSQLKQEDGEIQSSINDNDTKNINVLITGSLYLVGLALKVLNYKIA